MNVKPHETPIELITPAWPVMFRQPGAETDRCVTNDPLHDGPVYTSSLHVPLEQEMTPEYSGMMFPQKLDAQLVTVPGYGLPLQSCANLNANVVVEVINVIPENHSMLCKKHRRKAQRVSILDRWGLERVSHRQHNIHTDDRSCQHSQSS